MLYIVLLINFKIIYSIWIYIIYSNLPNRYVITVSYKIGNKSDKFIY